MMRAKAGRSDAYTMNDRERILMAVIDRLSTSQLLGPAGRFDTYNAAAWGDYAHFAYYKKPLPGDLVLAKSGFVSPWKVGIYVEKLPGPYGGAVIREIGTGRLCSYANEDFVPIAGMDKITLLEGDQREFYVKVLKAFRKGDEYCYRFGGIDFDDSNVKITIREIFGGVLASSQPFSITMEWSKRTSIRTILKAMRDGGYGTKSFRPSPAIEAQPAGNPCS